MVKKLLVRGKTPGQIFRILAWIVVAWLAFLFAIILIVNIPAVQTLITGYVSKLVSKKTGTEFSVGAVKIAFPKTVCVGRVYLAGQKADTLLYLDELRMNVDLFQLLRNRIKVKKLLINGLVSQITRKAPENEFNFQFVLDAFATKDSLTEPEKKPSKPWIFDVQNVEISNSLVVYDDDVAGLKAQLDLGELFLQNSTILASTALSTGDGKNSPENLHITSDTVQNSLFPNWNITIEKIELVNTDAKFDDVSAPKAPAGFDYGHLQIKGLNLETGAVGVSQAGAFAHVKNIHFSEQSGFALKKFAGQIEFSETTASMQHLEIETSESMISGDVTIGYHSFARLQTDPGETDISLNLQKLHVNTRDIFHFIPGLANDSIFGQFDNEMIIAKAEAGGKINNFTIENLDLSLFDFTRLKAKGSISGLPDISNLGFDATLNSLSTNQADLAPFLDSALLKNLTLPENFLIKGYARGKMDDFKAEMYVNTTFGDIFTEVFYQKPNPATRDSFNLTFELNQLMPGKILADTIFGDVTLAGNICGTGATSDSMTAQADIVIREARFNQYSYKDIEAQAFVNGKNYHLQITSEDPNVAFNVKSAVWLSAEKQEYSTHLHIGSLNLSALNFMNTETTISTTVAAKATADSSNSFNANIEATNTLIVHNKIAAPIQIVALEANYSENSLKASLTSDLLDATLNTNFDSQEFQKILTDMVNQYFGMQGSPNILPGYEMSFSLDVHLPNHIKNLISSDFDLSEIDEFQGFYNSTNNQLSVEMQLDDLIFADVNLDTIRMLIDGKNDSLSIIFDCRKISYDTLKVENIGISETIQKGVVQSEIRIDDQLGLPRYLFLNELRFTDSSLSVAFLPDGLVLNRQTWLVDKNNLITIGNNKTESQNFLFTHGQQSLELRLENENLALTLQKFNLLNIVNIVEFTRSGQLLSGDLEAEILFPVSENVDHFSVDLNIDSLFIYNTLAGQFSLKSLADSADLWVDLHIQNNLNEIQVLGNIPVWNLHPRLDLSVSMDFTSLESLEKYTKNFVSDLSGKVAGTIAITGTPDEPDFTGIIGFENAAMKINSLNVGALLKNEKLTFDNSGLVFDNFVVEDANQQKLTIHGSILTKNYSDFDFDLRIISENFQAINSTAKDNQLFYGDLFVNTNLKLTGNLNSPTIDASVKINKGTTLTYALPGSELRLITPEGIVHFVDPTASVDSALFNATGDFIQDSIMPRFTGIDLTVNLEIDEAAKFTVLIDPRSGDYLTLNGKAILSLSADPSGNQTITGIYEVKSGVYQLSFYGLVKKTFSIQQGSNVSWSGKPLDASLNITAGYEVTTNSVALLANETSSMSDTEKNIYKQRLPYMVLLNIDGFLDEPEISFSITLPDKYKINYPQVASKLDQLNTEDMDSERNKQVFALLVTGGFLADNPFASTGSSTADIATTAARNSVNGILADQLNNISNKYVKNVDLNFGLNSYEDYSGQSGEMRTELEVQVTKKLFNDRLTIEAQGYFDVEGSNKNTLNSQSSEQMWGEFAIIYDITPSGEYKLRAYRENAYDFFDGEVANSGIALIFEKEFDHLKRNKKIKKSQFQKQVDKPDKE